MQKVTARGSDSAGGTVLRLTGVSCVPLGVNCELGVRRAQSQTLAIQLPQLENEETAPAAGSDFVEEQNTCTVRESGFDFVLQISPVQR